MAQRRNRAFKGKNLLKPIQFLIYWLNLTLDFVSILFNKSPISVFLLKHYHFRKLRILKKTSPAVTFQVSCSTSLINNPTSNSSRPSKSQDRLLSISLRHATSHFVMNFEKLEPTLRSLHVQFNSKTVERIMTKERGQALRLLYQLKMVLEKVYPPADISIVAKTGTFGDNQPAQRIAHSKPKYDEVSHSFFKQRLGKLNRAQKDIDLELHQQKYEEEMQR